MADEFVAGSFNLQSVVFHIVHDPEADGYTAFNDELRVAAVGSTQ